MKRIWGVVAALVLMPSLAFAQVLQSGTVTANHATRWITNGVIGDAGTATNGSVTTFGITNTGTPFCINDALTTAAAGYHQFCLGSNLNSAGAVISYNAYGGAASLPIQVILNGVTTTLGTGSVNSGTGGNLGYYATTGTAISGATYGNISNGALTLGSAGTAAGSLVLSGSSSGTVTLGTGAAAGGYSFTLPSSAGTSGQVLTSAGGAQLTWTSSGGQVDVGTAGQFTYYPASTNEVAGTSVLSLSGTTVSTSGALVVGGALTASSGADTFSPSNANVVLSPTGTGVVTINPGSLGTLNNVSVGGSTPAAGSFTTLGATTTISAGVAASTSGTYNLSGGSSGTIAIKPQAAAGTYNFNLPITAGTSGQPMLSGGGGSGAMTWGSLSGNTSTFATTSGSLTSAHVAAFDASGNIVDGGAAPTGSINSGTAGQLTYYAGSGTTVSGNANLTVSAGALTVGVTGAAAGSVLFTGSSTGTVTMKGSSSTIGTYNFNLPTTAGTSGQPLLSGGGGASAMTYGTLSGTTSKFGTVTGSLTNGNCLAADASGNLIDNGSPCGSGGSGTVTSSTAGQVAYYASSTNAVAGNSALTIVGGAVTFGVPTTTQGQLKLSGSTTGTITVTGQAAAGTYEFDLPTTAGTSGQVLTSAGGAGSPMTWATVSSWPPAPTGISGDTTATANLLYCIDTTSAVVTLTLPASPSNGDKVGYIDCNSQFATHNLTVARNGHTIMGLSQNMTVNLNNQGGTLIYYSTNSDWRFLQ